MTLPESAQPGCDFRWSPAMSRLTAARRADAALAAAVAVPALAVTASPSPITLDGQPYDSTTTATASGGVPPYSYSWTMTWVWCPSTDDPASLFSVTNPTGASTSVAGSCSNIFGVGADPVAILQCVATDSIGETASVSVTAYQPGQSF